MFSVLFPFFFCYLLLLFIIFFFNDTATTEIYTLSLHDALPISKQLPSISSRHSRRPMGPLKRKISELSRSEEHTSELQSQSNLVCRLLLEKKKRCKHILLIQIAEIAWTLLYVVDQSHVCTTRVV